MGTNYFVIKEYYSYCLCSACNGAGKKNRRFQGHSFTATCTRCDGSGREKVTRRTEVPLAEALQELNKTINQKL